MQKAWLSGQGVSFEERDILEDAAAIEELQALGVFSTPATVAEGEVIVGFNREKLKQLLALP